MLSAMKDPRGRGITGILFGMFQVPVLCSTLEGPALGIRYAGVVLKGMFTYCGAAE